MCAGRVSGSAVYEVDAEEGGEEDPGGAEWRGDGGEQWPVCQDNEAIRRGELHWWGQAVAQYEDRQGELGVY